MNIFIFLPIICSLEVYTQGCSWRQADTAWGLWAVGDVLETQKANPLLDELGKIHRDHKETYCLILPLGRGVKASLEYQDPNKLYIDLEQQFPLPRGLEENHRNCGIITYASITVLEWPWDSWQKQMQIFSLQIFPQTKEVPRNMNLQSDIVKQHKGKATQLIESEETTTKTRLLNTTWIGIIG